MCMVTVKDPKHQPIILSLSKCALVWYVHGRECYLFGWAFALVSMLLNRMGPLWFSVCLLVLLRAASSGPAGGLPLYFFS